MISDFITLFLSPGEFKAKVKRDLHTKFGIQIYFQNIGPFPKCSPIERSVQYQYNTNTIPIQPSPHTIILKPHITCFFSRVIRTIKVLFFRLLTSFKTSNYDTIIKLAEFIYNTRPHSNLHQFSPYAVSTYHTKQTNKLTRPDTRLSKSRTDQATD